MPCLRLFLVWLTFAGVTFAACAGPTPSSVFLEDMTWPEVRQAIDAGAKTVIVPTGGTEQNGPHMVLGKHNRILAYTADNIARTLGNTLVAPVMAYVPEGNLSPPEGHMRFAGTLSLRDETFRAVIEDTVRSLKQHGFTTICLIAEHGGSRTVLEQVADSLSREWKSEAVKVVYVSHYYDEHNGQDAWLTQKGFPLPDIQGHAALSDTSELMAVYPNGVRKEKRAAHTPAEEVSTGVKASSKEATAELGNALLELKIAAAVKQIRQSSGAGSD